MRVQEGWFNMKDNQKFEFIAKGSLEEVAKATGDWIEKKIEAKVKEPSLKTSSVNKYSQNKKESLGVQG